MFSRPKNISQPVIEMIRRIDADQASVSKDGALVLLLTIHGVEELTIVMKFMSFDGWEVKNGWMTGDEKVAVKDAIFRLLEREKKKQESEERSKWLKALGVNNV